jgi:lysophospholipase L1-like esterase
MDIKVNNNEKVLKMKNKFKNIFLITVPVSIILFILLEITIRIAFDHIEYYDNPMDYWSKPSPYYTYTSKPGVYGEKTVNKHGFISTPEISVSKPKSTIRIVFLGESSTAGTGVNLGDEETWPWKTIELLKKKNFKVDFINAALGGYTSFESYGRLWSRIRFFKPDIVVVNHGWNEMYYFNDIADEPLKWRTEVGWEESNKMWNAIKYRLLSWSQVLVRIKLIINKNRSQNGEMGKDFGLSKKYNSQGLKILSENIKLFKSFGKTFDCEIFFCKQPTLITENTKDIDKARCNYEFHGFGHEEHVKAYNAVYSIIDSEFDKNNVIDLTPISGISENFYDAVHPTKKGADEIAKIVADSLEKHIIFLLNQKKINH